MQALEQDETEEQRLDSNGGLSQQPNDFIPNVVVCKEKSNRKGKEVVQPSETPPHKPSTEYPTTIPCQLLCCP